MSPTKLSREAVAPKKNILGRIVPNVYTVTFKDTVPVMGITIAVQHSNLTVRLPAVQALAEVHGGVYGQTVLTFDEIISALRDVYATRPRTYRIATRCKSSKSPIFANAVTEKLRTRAKRVVPTTRRPAENSTPAPPPPERPQMSGIFVSKAEQARYAARHGNNSQGDSE